MKWIAAVLVLPGACGGANAPTEVVAPTAPVAAPVTPTAETAPDGRPLEYGTVPLWCYDDGERIFGGRCFDEMASCDKDLAGVRERAVVDMNRRLTAIADEDARWKAAVKVAFERWGGCVETRFAACFWFADVVSGIRIRSCTTTVASCEKERGEAADVPDVKIESPTCVVFRVR